MRLAVLTNAPATHRSPIFERLARAPGVELRVFFDAASDATLVDDRLDFPHEHLEPRLSFRPRDAAARGERGTLRYAFSYLPRLAAFRPDAIVSGEFGWRTLNAAAFAGVARIPLLVWWTGTRSTERRIGRLRRSLRWGLTRATSGLLGAGRVSVEYLESLAPARVPIHFVPQAADNLLFQRETARWRREREALRERLGIRGVGLLCVGRLVAQKGIAPYVEALLRLGRRLPAGSFTALFAGAGPEGARLEAAKGDPRIEIRWLGAVAHDELPRLHAASDVLVFPTLHDSWGLVVNEALAAGLPVIGSCRSGAATELLRDPALGAVIDPLDASAFDAALRAAVEERRWLDTPRERLRRTVEAYSFERASQAMLDAVEHHVRGRT